MLDLIPSIIAETLKEKLKPAELKDFSFIPGGCINHGGILVTSKANLFIKWNDASAFPNMFECEAKGLELLAHAKSIRVPKVVGYDECGIFQFILLEWIDCKNRAPDFWKLLGQRLASLHGHSSSAFGLDHHNFIGSLAQQNTPCHSWIDFFIRERLEVQMNLASHHESHYGLNKKMDKLYTKLPNLLPEGKPALIHGDLWGGNLIADETGQPCLLDPAVYYGNREMELAYTQLFDQFDKTFYQAYQAVFPLEPKFEERVDIYNLYPLLVHANLFGGNYFHQVAAILNRFI